MTAAVQRPLEAEPTFSSPFRGEAVEELDAVTGELPVGLADRSHPLVLRGLVSAWPVVREGRRDAVALHDYLSRFDEGATVPVSVGPSTLGGRLFYDEDFAGLNVDQGQAPIGSVLSRIRDHGGRAEPPLIYLASAKMERCLPGFRAENDVVIADADPLASIWIGTRTRVAAHNDLPLNLACVAAGRRRFTLFPPEQVANLYVGPFELTPAGRPISLVDFAAPDRHRFPLFAKAEAAAVTADLEAGDALFIPSMWWHHVEACGAFSVLVNYWWRTVPTHLGTPQDVLTHAMMTLRELPEQEREAWRALFDHYVFRPSPELTDHVPERARGVLGPMSSERARQVRAYLLNRLNR